MSAADHASRSAVCTNVPDCLAANAGTALEWQPGDYCPECGETLIPVPVRATPIARPGERRMLPGAPAGPANRALAPQPYVATVHLTATELGQVLKSRNAPSWPLRVLILAGFTLAPIVGFLVFRPQITEFAVAQTASAGAPLQVVYRATGLGAVRYTLLGADGQTVADAPLAPNSGSFALTLPGATVARTYLLRLDAGNVLGAASAERYITVPAQATPVPQRAARPKPVARPVEPPQIRSFALDRATLAGGDTFTVYYDVLAAHGTIVLFDPTAQLTYATAEIAPSGRTTFTAPRFDAERLLTLTLTVQRGKAAAQSRIGVTVTPQVAQASQSDAGPRASDGDGGSSIALSAAASVHSRQQFRVDVQGSAAGLELALIDANGNRLASQVVSAGQTSVIFTAPAVASTTRLSIEGTYPSGVGSETIVKVITVTP